MTPGRRLSHAAAWSQEGLAEQRAADLYAQGWSLRQIGAELGVAIGTWFAGVRQPWRPYWASNVDAFNHAMDAARYGISDILGGKHYEFRVRTA
jgi:hypothetical protein